MKNRIANWNNKLRTKWPFTWMERQVPKLDSLANELDLKATEVERKAAERANTTTIKEIKRTCTVCGTIWHNSSGEEMENFANKLSNAGKSSLFLGGSLLTLLVKKKDVVDLSKCPNCGSIATTKEKVVRKLYKS